MSYGCYIVPYKVNDVLAATLVKVFHYKQRSIS